MSFCWILLTFIWTRWAVPQFWQELPGFLGPMVSKLTQVLKADRSLSQATCWGKQEVFKPAGSSLTCPAMLHVLGSIDQTSHQQLCKSNEPRRGHRLCSLNFWRKPSLKSMSDLEKMCHRHLSTSKEVENGWNTANIHQYPWINIHQHPAMLLSHVLVRLSQRLSQRLSWFLCPNQSAWHRRARCTPASPPRTARWRAGTATAPNWSRWPLGRSLHRRCYRPRPRRQRWWRRRWRCHCTWHSGPHEFLEKLLEVTWSNDDVMASLIWARDPISKDWKKHEWALSIRMAWIKPSIGASTRSNTHSEQDDWHHWARLHIGHVGQ